MKRINTATVSFAEQPFEEGEEGGASTTTAMTRARALPARLNVDTVSWPAAARRCPVMSYATRHCFAMLCVRYPMHLLFAA